MSERLLNISIVPGGAFGTALTVPLVDNEYQPLVYLRSLGEAEELEQRHAHKGLPDVILPSLGVTNSLQDAMEEVDVVVFAAPSSEAVIVFEAISQYDSGKTLYLSVVKGLVGGRTTSQMISQANPSVSERLAVLSGPNFAIDIAKRLPTGTVIASVNETTQRALQEIFSTKDFHVHPEKDVLGVELGGASKNVDALALGICAGHEANEMMQALIAVQSLRETSELGMAMGAQRETFYGPSGLGDLLLTGRSEKSRNFTAGIALGRGIITPEALFNSAKTVEGIYAAKGIMTLSEEYGVTMPVKKLVFDALYNGVSISDTYRGLLSVI